VSAAFLLTAPGDGNEAADLGVQVLTPPVAKRRWDHLWEHRELLNGRTFVDLESSWGVGRGDYNRRWNAQLIQGLVELRELRRDQFDVEDLGDLIGENSTQPTEWTAISRVEAGLGMPTFWDERWLPWQQRETSRSTESLRRIREVALLKTGACEGISDAYAPSPELRDMWGNRVQFMEPVGPCGRCPDCRVAGIAPVEDISPSPEQEWAVRPCDLTELGKFIASCRGLNGLALLTHTSEDDELVGRLANALLRLGVRHFSGLPVSISATPAERIFVDDLPLAPVDLTPVSSLTYFAPAQSISAWWLVRRRHPRPRGRDASALCDVLLVPVGSRIGDQSVGKDLPAIPAATAVELLHGS